MMKKNIPTFLAGMLTATLIFGLGFSALAVTGAIGTVEYNTMGLMKDGEQVFYAGEDYLLENGYLAPTSILFTDPSGNGTTYLPVRRIAELFHTDITWEDEAVVLGPVVTPQPSQEPVPAPVPAG